MLFLKNSSRKKCNNTNKVSLLHLFTFLCQILTGKVTHSIHNMTADTGGLKGFSYETFFLKRLRISDF